MAKLSEEEIRKFIEKHKDAFDPNRPKGEPVKLPPYVPMGPAQSIAIFMKRRPSKEEEGAYYESGTRVIVRGTDIADQELILANVSRDGMDKGKSSWALVSLRDGIRWTNAMDFETPDFTRISRDQFEQLLNRQPGLQYEIIPRANR